MIEGLNIFVTYSEVEAMLRRENEYASSVYLDLKPPYLTEMDAKPYPTGYAVPQS